MALILSQSLSPACPVRVPQQGQRMKDFCPIFRTANLNDWDAAPPRVLPMTRRSLDHAPITIPNRATRGRECSYPKTIGFSCVVPVDAADVSGHPLIPVSER